MSNRHRESNTFRFRSFNERVQGVRVSAAHRLKSDRAVRLAADGADSAFVASITRWTELDLSRPFQMFYRDLHLKVDSYALVISNQQNIFETISRHLDCDHLNKNGWTAVSALLEFIVSLATDLASDFNQYFFASFNLLEKLLVTRDLTLLENIFTCLSRLIKLCNRFLRLDMSKTVDIFISMVGNEKREHVRNFAGDAFAFLLRKHVFQKNDIIAFWTDVTTRYESAEDVLTSLGVLLFQSMRGVQSGIDSRGLAILDPLLNLPNPSAEKIIKSGHSLLFEHLVRQNTKELLDQLLGCNLSERRVKLLCQLVEYKGGVLVYDVKYITNFLNQNENNFDIIPLIESFLLSTMWLTDETRSKSIDILAALSTTSTCLSITSVFQQLAGQDWFARCGKAQMMEHVKFTLQSTSEESEEETGLLKMLLRYVLTHYTDVLNDSFVGPVLEWCEPLVERLKNICLQPDVEKNWSALVVLSHVSHRDGTIFKFIFSLLDGSPSKGELWLGAIYNALAIGQYSELSGDTILQQLSSNPTSLPLLRCLKTFLEFGTAPKNGHDDIYKIIKSNLSSHLYPVRLVTLQILAQTVEDETEREVVSLLLNAERCEISLVEYRTRLNTLRRAETTLEGIAAGSETFTRYLIGSLFINFALFLPETKKHLISNIRRQLEMDKESTLEYWLETMEVSLHRTSVDPPPFSELADNGFGVEIKNYFTPPREGVNEKCDFIAFRDHIWSLSCQLSTWIEPVSRRIIPMFFHFVEQEYTRDLRFQNLQPTSGEETDEVKGKISRQRTKKMLINCFRLFGSFHNPAVLFREKELKTFSIDLLQSPDGTLQAAAIDFLSAYKKGTINKYKSIFSDLVKDDAFKTTFKKIMLKEDGGEEKDGVKEEDEDEVVDFTLRIAFGKMISKISIGTAGKGSSNERQKFIIRHLADTKMKHLELFYSLATSCIEYLTSSDDRVERCWPLGKQLGTLQTMQTIIRNVSWSSDHVSSTWRSSVLATVIQFGEHAMFLIGKPKESLKPSALRQLKDLRSLSIQTVESFSQHTKHTFTQCESDRIVLWLKPLLVGLEHDALDKSSPVLRLIIAWSELDTCQPMLYALVDTTPILSHVVSLLKADVVSKDVSLAIIKLVSRLFSDEQNAMDVDGGNPDPARSKCLSLIIPDLITFFTAIVSKKSARGLDKDVLQLIVYISVDTDDDELCSKLSLLIINHLKSKSYFLRLDLLKSLSQLLLKTSVDRYQVICDDLIGLCGTIGTDLHCRSQLVDCFKSLTLKDEGYTRIFQIVNEFNAVRKHLHDPIDFERRLDAINVVANLKERDFTDLTYWRAVLVNALYLYQNVDDLSIQTAASRLIIVVVKSIPSDSDAYKLLVTKIILTQIRKMLKSRKEKIRFEFVQLLAQLIRLFDDKEIRELKCLTDENLELDFFENVTHLQLHRRQRAYNRATKAIEARSVRPSTAERYLFPLALCTLLDPKLERQTQLLAAALDVVAAIAKYMSWSNFRRLLDMQLMLSLKGNKDKGKMLKDKPKSKKFVEVRNAEVESKMTIKIICRLLEAIHWPIETLDEHFTQTVNLFSRTSSSLTIQHIREFEQIQLDKATEIDAETVVEIDGATGTEIEQADDEMIGSDVEEVIEEEEEMIEDVTVKHSTEVLKKVYTHLHLVVRPKLSKLITPKPKEVTDDSCEKEVHTPLAAALINVLIKLGPECIRSYCPSVILKLVDMLRSREFSQREIARKALLNAFNALGDSWFGLFLDELKSGLQRGYQRHVLIASLHALLQGHEFTPGSIDGRVEDVNEILMSDLVGELGKEKKIGKIVGKTPEAKGANYVIGCYKKLGLIISPNALNRLLHPLKERLLQSIDQKEHLSIYNALMAISEGFIANSSFSADNLVSLVASILTEKSVESIEKSKKKKIARPGEKPESCFLLDKPVVRGGAKPKLNSITNRHYLNQFSLRLIGSAIKQGKVDISDESKILSKLDGLIAILIGMLDASRHADECCLIFRIMHRAVKQSNFSTLHDPKQFKILVEKYFTILKTHCRGTQTSNGELVTAAFKAVTTLIGSSYGPLPDTYLKVLLGYAEEDLYNVDRQTSAFPLLQALLKRQNICDEMEHVGRKVLQLAVQADTDAGRNSARNYFISFLLEYPLGEKKIARYIDNLLGNLSYGIASGRESVIECIRQIVKQFPERLMKHRSSLFFTALCTTFAGDASVGCRESAAAIILDLVEKYPSLEYSMLILAFLRNENVEQKRLSCLLICLLGDKLKADLQMEQIIKIFVDMLSDDLLLQADDALIIALLQAFQKVMDTMDLMKQFKPEVIKILTVSDGLLVHPHAWVRESSATLILTVLADRDDQMLASGLDKYWDGEKARSLCLKTICQLKCKFVERDHMSSCKKLLLYFMQLFKHRLDNNGEANTKPELLWLIQKLNGVAAEENSDRPGETVRREIVAELLIQFVHTFENKSNVPYLNIIMEVFFREAAATPGSTQTSEELRKTMHQAAMVIKKMIGEDLFGENWEKARKQISKRRIDRRKGHDEKAVIDPEVFNQIKIKKQEKEKLRRKRKIQEMKLKPNGVKVKKFNTLEKM